MIIMVFKLIGSVYCQKSTVLRMIGVALLLSFIGDLISNLSILFLYDYFLESNTLVHFQSFEFFTLIALEIAVVVLFIIGLRHVRSFENVYNDLISAIKKDSKLN